MPAPGNGHVGHSHGSGAAALLARLEGVRQTGPDRWLARCPAHADKHPSLSVRELGDGRVLVHDFGGCGTDAVLAAVGLGLADLFPAKLPAGQHAFSRAPRPPAADILAATAHEVEVVAVAAAALSSGVALNAEDHDRLRLAASRLRAAAGCGTWRAP